jgi:hypothetical protein
MTRTPFRVGSSGRSFARQRRRAGRIISCLAVIIPVLALEARAGGSKLPHTQRPKADIKAHPSAFSIEGRLHFGG